MEIKQLDPNDLINYEYNNKTHNKKQIDLLANSIKEYWMNKTWFYFKNLYNTCKLWVKCFAYFRKNINLVS